MIYFKIAKGKLKQVNSERPWQKYLIGKVMILCTNIGGGWEIAGIEGESDSNGLCRYAWETEPEHEYESLEDFQEEVAMGNDGFGLDLDEVEIIEEFKPKGA